MNARHAACPDELREALDSPVPSIRTPFTADGQIDYNGVRSQVDFLIAGKARTLLQAGTIMAVLQRGQGRGFRHGLAHYPRS